ncbi:DUF2125 domain-containing protein [Brevundimonas naejangsanensis]|uniref:DUF2125 domain-containing protein n=1 Tax=Brevundimonas naejangsanensis TaxID=588932 RepID=A0A494RF13_9CAUL|nr:DUF2125 domain-containing protein [Brevundimonas naejangsanensis]AYG94895.1 DUF2125 domain-containing protein [Brevundimonas naejangsanensis]
MTDAPPHHSRKGLIVPFAIVAVGLALWTGWWFYLTRQIETRLEAKVAGLEQAGWRVTHADLRTTGWPMHARVTIRHLDVVAPSGHAVAAPVVIAQANAYNPTRWVMAAPDGLVVTRGVKGKAAIRAEGIRMSVHGLTQRWPNVALELEKPVFTALPGAEPFPLKQAGLVQFYMRPHLVGSDTPTDDVDVLFRLVDAEGRPGGPVEGFAQSGKLNAQIEAVIEKASALRRGADAHGLLSAWTAAGGRFIDVKGELGAGESKAFVSAESLSADDKGRLEGQVFVRAEKPLAAIVGLAGAQQGGALDRAAAAKAAAATPQGGTGADGQGVELSILFRDGRTYLGPFALAPAPQLF